MLAAPAAAQLVPLFVDLYKPSGPVCVIGSFPMLAYTRFVFKGVTANWILPPIPENGIPLLQERRALDRGVLLLRHATRESESPTKTRTD